MSHLWYLPSCDYFHRDIAKNSLLQWSTFIYWTVLGVYDAIVMFFGAYFLFDNTTFTSNGQVTPLCLWRPFYFSQGDFSFRQDFLYSTVELVLADSWAVVCFVFFNFAFFTPVLSVVKDFNNVKL